MVNVEVTGELPGVSEVGEKVAVAPVGRPLAANVTALENEPFCAVTVIVYWAEAPGCTVCAPVGELRVKVGAATAEKSAITLSGALMVTVVEALLVLVTLPVQLVKL